MTQREAFETFSATGYATVRSKILALLDRYTEEEAIAQLDMVRAEINMRTAWAVSSAAKANAPSARRVPGLVDDCIAAWNSREGYR